MPRVGPACAVSKLSGTFDENELELAASPGPRRAGSSIDPTSADKIKKLEAALEQVLVFVECRINTKRAPTATSEDDRGEKA